MMIRLALAASALLLCACQDTSSAAPELVAEPVVLFPDDPGRERIGALRFTGGVALSSDDERFGGWSAMELSQDGTRLLALSDRATWMTASLQFDEAGHLTGLDDVLLAPMLDAEGDALSGNQVDAEGLAPLGDGRYAVSFERNHRIEGFELGADWSGITTATATPLPAPPGANRLRNNAGIEALAASAGTFWAGVEYPIIEGQPYTLWRFDPGEPQIAPASVPLTLAPGHGLTAMAADNRGGLFVVERFYARNVGNRIRIGRYSAAMLDSGGAPTLLADLGPDMTVDNFEAIAMQEEAEQTRLFLMSDDNFNYAQRTLLLSFVIEP